MATSRKNRPAMRLVFSATQGSADAFKEVEVNTGLSTLSNTGYRILEIGIQIPLLPNATSGINVAISRQSNASMPTLDDRSLIYKQSKGISFTTSGSAFQGNLIERWQPIDDANVILVEEVIYVDLSSSNTSATNTIYGYILVDPITVSDADKTALIAQSLANV